MTCVDQQHTCALVRVCTSVRSVFVVSVCVCVSELNADFAERPATRSTTTAPTSQRRRRRRRLHLGTGALVRTNSHRNKYTLAHTHTHTCTRLRRQRSSIYRRVRVRFTHGKVANMTGGAFGHSASVVVTRSLVCVRAASGSTCAAVGEYRWHRQHSSVLVLFVCLFVRQQFA